MPETFWILGLTKKRSRHANKAHRLPGAWALYCRFSCIKGATHEHVRPTEMPRPYILEESRSQSNHGLRQCQSLNPLRLRKIARERGVAALTDRSKAPHHRRHRQWPLPVCARIRYLRQYHPNLKPHKVWVLLPCCKQQRLACPSTRTIAKLIADADDIPVVSVFISGRPMWVNPEINSSDAFIAA